MKAPALSLIAVIWLTACQAQTPEQTTVADRAQSGKPSADSKATMAAVGKCPFRKTEDWHSSVEGGRLLVNGKVDLMMAGMKPVLTKRASAAPGTVAFDLSLVQEAGAVVDDRPRYTESGSPAYRRAEIYCGGERIAAIDTVLVG